jgi:hypothetical protein
MSRTTLNLLVDIALLVVFLAVVWTGVVVRYLFPQPMYSQGWRLWGLTLSDWLNAHTAALGVMALVVLLHVMLHWSWVCGVLVTRWTHDKSAANKLDDGTRTLWGVGLLIALLLSLGLLTALAALTIQPPA